MREGARCSPVGSAGGQLGEVLFDVICAENGVRHLLTAPSADHNRKVDRWHKTMRAEFLTEHDHQHATQADCRLESVKLAV
jgi:hypothetical protein